MSTLARIASMSPVLLVGCSLVFSKPPDLGPPITATEEPGCRGWLLPPLVDSGVAIVIVVLAGGTAISWANDREASWGIAAIGGAISAPFALSAWYGIRARSLCGAAMDAYVVAQETAIDTRWASVRAQQRERSPRSGAVGQECHLGVQPGSVECEAGLECIVGVCQLGKLGARFHRCKWLTKDVLGCDRGLHCVDGTCQGP